MTNFFGNANLLKVRKNSGNRCVSGNNFRITNYAEDGNLF